MAKCFLKHATKLKSVALHLDFLCETIISKKYEIMNISNWTEKQKIFSHLTKLCAQLNTESDEFYNKNIMANKLSQLSFPKLEHLEMNYNFGDITMIAVDPFCDILRTKIKDKTIKTIRYIKFMCNKSIASTSYYSSMIFLLKQFPVFSDLLEFIMIVNVDKTDDLFEKKTQEFIKEIKNDMKAKNIDFKLKLGKKLKKMKNTC